MLSGLNKFVSCMHQIHGDERESIRDFLKSVALLFTKLLAVVPLHKVVEERFLDEALQPRELADKIDSFRRAVDQWQVN